MKIQSSLRTGLLALATATAFICGSAVAQTAAPATSVPGHPRVNEVSHRVDNQQRRTDVGLANGTITGKQAARDESRDANIAQRESADQAKHNGHLTKAETHNLNRAENRNSRRIHRQRKH